MIKINSYFLVLLLGCLCLETFAQTQPALDSVTFNGGSLFYHVYGKGKPVIILTGGPGISYQQQEEVAIEVGKRYQAILLEQRGTGRSMPAVLDKETVNLNTAVSNLNLLLDHMHLQEAAFYGHSYGSFLAVCYANKFPSRVSRLILTGPAPFSYLGDQMTTYGTPLFSLCCRIHMNIIFIIYQPINLQRISGRTISNTSCPITGNPDGKTCLFPLFMPLDSLAYT